MKREGPAAAAKGEPVSEKRNSHRQERGGWKKGDPTCLRRTALIRLVGQKEMVKTALS